MNQFKLVYFLFVIMAIANHSNAENFRKLKYGKVTIEELQMKTYEKDTSADAVMLYQYAEFIPAQFSFSEHYRTKILKKSGTSRASMVFNGKLKQNIKACTYNLENGEIVKTKLDNESIFEEKVIGNRYRTRIALPNVKEGSVFEVQIYRDGLPNAYEIQTDIPLIYGGLYFPKHPNVDIRINEIGYLGYAFKGDDLWIAKDMPAFKDEPYITSDKDYRVRLEFELLSYNFIGARSSAVGFFASSWDAVLNNFMENEFLGSKLLEMSFFLNQVADSIKMISKSDEELVKNAYEEIKKIKWNGQEECLVSQELKKTYQLKQGNSADINLNLVLLLKKLGLISYPVVFSTYSNGRISKFNPTLNKFNYVIAAVELPSGKKYLDATNEFMPYGLEPEIVSRCWGLPITGNKGNCSVFIEPSKKLKKSSYSQFTIDSSGVINGKISIKRTDYNAIAFKKLLKSKPDHESYIQELESSYSGWYINGFKFNNYNDAYSDFIDEYDVKYSNSIGTSDEILLNPFAFISMNNPFQKDKRSLPVNFPLLTEYSSIIIINIPSNYKIAELPKSIEISNNDKSIKFLYQINAVGNTISISTKFNINKYQYEVYEYPGLRSVYEMMLQKQKENILLMRI